MMKDKLPIAIIIGSNRQGRLGDKIGAWVAETARAIGRFHVDVIDVAHLNLPEDYPAVSTETVLDFQRRIATAAAFVVVTPEYNHSFPGALKHAIDQAYEQWWAKPVAFVSYGGQSGGLRAVEALRLVFAELQAVTIRDGVAFPQAWTIFGDEPYEPEQRVSRAAAGMYGQLAWWATTLLRGRSNLPLETFLPLQDRGSEEL
jgi:NAD(P)H-dependent FMN reductase